MSITLRRRLYRRRRAGSGRTCRTSMSQAASRTSRSLPRQTNWCARRCHAVFLYHAIGAGMDMGIVNAGQIAGVRRPQQGTARRPARTSCSTAAPMRPNVCLRRAAPSRSGQGKKKKPICRGASGRWRSACRMRSSTAITDYIAADVRGSAAQGAAPARRDRRPADGRHERGRRSVRLGTDVPASGGQVGARDEAGRRASHAVHGTGEGMDANIHPRTARS